VIPYPVYLNNTEDEIDDEDDYYEVLE